MPTSRAGPERPVRVVSSVRANSFREVLCSYHRSRLCRGRSARRPHVCLRQRGPAAGVSRPLSLCRGSRSVVRSGEDHTARRDGFRREQPARSVRLRSPLRCAPARCIQPEPDTRERLERARHCAGTAPPGRPTVDLLVGAAAPCVRLLALARAGQRRTGRDVLLLIGAIPAEPVDDVRRAGTVDDRGPVARASARSRAAMRSDRAADRRGHQPELALLPRARRASAASLLRSDPEPVCAVDRRR